MRLSTMTYQSYFDTFCRITHASKDTVVNLIKGDYQKGITFISQLELELNSLEQYLAGQKFLLELWEFLWYYKRNFHVVYNSNNAMSLAGTKIDVTPLSKLDKDINIDTCVGGRQLFIKLSHRDHPLVINGTLRLDWSVSVWISKHKYMLFHFATSDNLRKVYTSEQKVADLFAIRKEASPTFKQEDSILKSVCEKCNGCGSVTDQYGQAYRRYAIHKQDCQNPSYLNPLLHVAIIMDVVNTYVNRKKVTRKQSLKPTESDKLMVVRRDIDNDTERVMSLYDYEYTYRPSARSEYKGGHHASPVSHPRNSYYRSCKRGNYILTDGKFVEVPRGTGDFIYVRSTIVRPDKATTVAEMI